MVEEAGGACDSVVSAPNEKLAIIISQCQNEEHTPERDDGTEIWGVFTACISSCGPKIK